MIHEPLHPGEIVREVCIDGLDEKMTIAKLASYLDVDRTTLSRLINGRARMSPEMAMRLSIAFDSDPNIWLNLQRDYDLWQLRKERNKMKVRRLAA